MGVDLRMPDRPDWDFLRLRYGDCGLLTNAADLLDVARVSRGRFCYLATPFAGAVVRRGRFRRGFADVVASEAALWCLWGAANGLTLVSPVAHAMSMLEQDLGGTLDPLDRDFWQRWTLPLLQAAGGVVVPPMEGWQQSDGVWRACGWALRHNIRVFLLRGDVSAAALPRDVAGVV